MRTTEETKSAAAALAGNERPSDRAADNVLHELDELADALYVDRAHTQGRQAARTQTRPARSTPAETTGLGGA